MRLFFGLVVMIGMATACGSSADEPTSDKEEPKADAGAREDAATDGASDATDGGSDAGESDAGGRDAEFTHVALCTANWLEHDIDKLYRFAVEYAEKPKLPNGNEAAMLWWTPLRASASSLQAAATVGGTFGVEQETVLETMDAQLPDLTLPASANPENEELSLKTVVMNVEPPSDQEFCGTLSAEQTVPEKMEVDDGQIGPYLRCVFLPARKGQPLPTVTADDYTSAPCRNWSYVW